jgi:group I intron endonuclease
MTKDYYLKKTCGIYCITHKENNKQYIGQSVDCFERWKQHQTPKKGSTGIKAAIMKHGINSFTFEVLEECSKDLLNEREVYFIAEKKTLSPLGYNLTSGGSAPTETSKETKEKMSAASKGKKKAPFSAEHIAKISAANKGRKTSDETKAKLSIAGMRRKTSDETKAKMSAAIKGKKRSEETCKKMSAARTGKKTSEETKAKMSTARKEYLANKKAQASSEERSII